MNAAVILAELHSHGSTVRIKDDVVVLEWGNAGPPPADLIERARAQKPALRSLLLAAVAPIGGDVTAGVARLATMAPPADFTDTRWQAAQEAARYLQAEHAAKALALGWRLTDLFGAHPSKPAARLDHAGLVLLLDLASGDRVASPIGESVAVIVKGSGTQTKFRRNATPGAVLLWELCQ
jgi:hypothetical protein